MKTILAPFYNIKHLDINYHGWTITTIGIFLITISLFSNIINEAGLAAWFLLIFAVFYLDLCRYPNA